MINAKLTKHKDIKQVLTLLSARLKKIFGDKLFAVYLTGSLTYGGFDYGSSDIDLLVVLTEKFTKNELESVKEMHKKIAQKVPYWEKRLEVSYIPIKWLEKSSPPGTRPYFNGGKLGKATYGYEWLLNIHVIQKYGVALLGPNPKSLIKPVDLKDLKEASRRDLLDEWQPKLKIKDMFCHPLYDSSHLQAYAILSMCRILYTAKREITTSKKEASTWAKKIYGKQWNNLIEKAENWKHGVKLNLKKETKSFIKFTLNEVKITN